MSRSKGGKTITFQHLRIYLNPLDEYVKYIENQTKTPISLISLGKNGTDTAERKKILTIYS